MTVDGAPGAITIVTFWPTATDAPPDQAGQVVADKDGKFSIGDPARGTGLMPGEYKVTFSRFVDSSGKPTFGGGKKSEANLDAPATESLPDNYRDPKSTPATAVVASSSTTFTFDLTSKKKK